MPERWEKRYVDDAELSIAQIRKLQATLESGAANPDAQLAAGKICEFLSNDPEAAQIYTLLTQDPEASPEARGRLAISLCKLGQHHAAMPIARSLVSDFRRKVIETLAGTPLSVITILADILLMHGERSEARALYKEALSIEPHDQRAGSQLVQLLVDDGEIDEAKTLSKDVVFEPGRKPLQALLGLSQEKGSELPGISKIKLAGGAAAGNV